MKGNSFIWYHFKVKETGSLCIPCQFSCICRTSLVCFGPLVFCLLLFLKSKFDRWQSSGVEVRWSLRKFKKGKTFYGCVHVCTYWCFFFFFFFFFSAVDRLSFFLWWEKESKSRQIIWALLRVCIYLFLLSIELLQ